MRFSQPRETKIFDPRDPAIGLNGAELLDSTVIQRDNQWWMFLAGQANGYGATDLFSASLPSGAPLSAQGWTPTRNAAGELVSLAGRNASQCWDGNGGRHCPSWVKGWDPEKQRWAERIYYAGAAENLWGPYTIGYLEWDGERWLDQPAPVFTATEDWERGSVYEPNLICHEGKWKMWYVAGSNQQDYLIHGYSESEDGRNWGSHTIFAPPELKMFDFCVRPRGNGFDAVYSRVWVSQDTPPPSETGLWWCNAEKPSGKLSDWSEPMQIMTAEDRGWHSGPWKPSLTFPEPNNDHAFIFFDGLYRTTDPGPFPFAFTLGCLEIMLAVD
jgi:hypothetical protein